MHKRFAGTSLEEIREALKEEGFTEMHEDNGDKGFDLWRPFDDVPQHDCAHAAVWPKADGGFWVEEY